MATTTMTTNETALVAAAIGMGLALMANGERPGVAARAAIEGLPEVLAKTALLGLLRMVRR